MWPHPRTSWIFARVGEEGPPSPDGSSMLPSPSRWVQHLWPESYRVACSLCWTGNQAGQEWAAKGRREQDLVWVKATKQARLPRSPLGLPPDPLGHQPVDLPATRRHFREEGGRRRTKILDQTTLTGWRALPLDVRVSVHRAVCCDSTCHSGSHAHVHGHTRG